MTTNLQVTNQDKQLVDAIEQAVTAGNLNGLTPPQRLFYYKQVCESVGLNPLTRPLDFIQLNGKLVLYAKKDATDQIRKIHGVSITKVEQMVQEGCCIVTAFAKDKNGKEDSDVGAVPLVGLKGDAYANAIMKAVTKAKRRVTLSICGMGLLDESELDTVSGAIPQPIDMAEKSASQTKRLKEKAALLPPPLEMDHVEVANNTISEEKLDKPPPVPFAAKKKTAKPEVIPMAAEPATPMPSPVKAGDTLVPNSCPHAGKKFNDLERSELTDVARWIVKGATIEKWTGPKFLGFKAQFEAYVSQFQELGDDMLAAVNPPISMDEPEKAPPPPATAKKAIPTQMVQAYEDHEDPGAFFEKPKDNDFVTIAINRLKNANNADELAAARKQFQLDCKDANKINLSGLPPTEARKIMADAAMERDKADARIKAAK